MEKNSNKLPTLLKNIAISVVLGHASAILFLFLTGMALAKNADPTPLMPVAALIALFVGAVVCGAVSGKRMDGPFGGALSGLGFSGVLIAISLLLNAILPASEEVGGDGYGFGFKIGVLAGATMLSSLVGLWINARKSSKKGASRHRRRAIGR